jgi:hypothetical protein
MVGVRPTAVAVALPTAVTNSNNLDPTRNGRLLKPPFLFLAAPVSLCNSLSPNVFNKLKLLVSGHSILETGKRPDGPVVICGVSLK